MRGHRRMWGAIGIALLMLARDSGASLAGGDYPRVTSTNAVGSIDPASLGGLTPCPDAPYVAAFVGGGTRDDDTSSLYGITADGRIDEIVRFAGVRRIDPPLFSKDGLDIYINVDRPESYDDVEVPEDSIRHIDLRSGAITTIAHFDLLSHFVLMPDGKRAVVGAAGPGEHTMDNEHDGGPGIPPPSRILDLTTGVSTDFRPTGAAAPDERGWVRTVPTKITASPVDDLIALNTTREQETLRQFPVLLLDMTTYEQRMLYPPPPPTEFWHENYPSDFSPDG